LLVLQTAASLLDLWLLPSRCAVQQGLTRQLQLQAAVGAHQLLQLGAPAAQRLQNHPPPPPPPPLLLLLLSLLLLLQGCAVALHQRQRQQEQSQAQALRQGLVLAASGVTQLLLAIQAPVQGAAPSGHGLLALAWPLLLLLPLLLPAAAAEGAQVCSSVPAHSFDKLGWL
jgi:hypothetical protein